MRERVSMKWKLKYLEECYYADVFRILLSVLGRQACPPIPISNSVLTFSGL